MGPAKVKMIETVEKDIEEMEMTVSNKSLPAVQQPADRKEARAAFAPEKSDSFEQGIECPELWDIPGPSSGTPR